MSDHPTGLSKDPHLPIRKVFKCSCGRMQSYKPPGENRYGGAGQEVVERIGWRQVGGGWMCPMCSGNEAMLRRVFMGDEPAEPWQCPDCDDATCDGSKCKGPPVD